MNLLKALFISLLILPGCMPVSTHAQIKPEPEKIVTPGPFKPDREQESEVKGISIEAMAKDSLVETLRYVLDNGSGGRLIWESNDGKPHVIKSNGTEITLYSGTRIPFSFKVSGDEVKSGLFGFDKPQPNVSVDTGLLKLKAPAVSVLFKPDNSADATVDIGFGIHKTKSLKIAWDTETQGSAQPDVAEVKRPLVWCYTTPGCGPCEQAKRALSGAKLPYDVRFTENAPQWVTSFPTMHWNDSKGVGRKAVGWVGVQELTRLVMESQQAAVSSGPRWTYAGGDTKPALIEHLLRDGIHKGKFSKDYLERLSRDALVQLHSDDHNGIYRN